MESNKASFLGNQGYVAPNKNAVLVIKSRNLKWHFNNAASYYVTHDLANFDDPNSLTQYCHLEDNITMADRSVILLNKIGTITFTFCTKNSIETIFFLEFAIVISLILSSSFWECWIAKIYLFFPLVGYLRYEIKNYQLC